jgi:ethanolamine ammonia-lyase small subunit
MNRPVSRNPWELLKAHTGARIALGRSGGSLPTAPLLEFQLAHARARDAVHKPFSADDLQRAIEALGVEVLRVRSRAAERTTYLQRPDLGRRLDDDSRDRLADHGNKGGGNKGCDALFVIADGLSTLAVEANAQPVLELIRATLMRWGWRTGPVVIAEQSRVALGDEIGELLGAAQVAILIGERPGLSAADSLGIYLTWQPRVGRTDAERNCISNIHPRGLTCEQAAHKLAYLMREARARGLTGVALKDESERVPLLV